MRVCHHGHYWSHCGTCVVDGKNCLDLDGRKRVVCRHGAGDGDPWKGACVSCFVDGQSCVIIELFQRVVCTHRQMREACVECRIDNARCLVLNPGERVVCWHRNFTGYCGQCYVDGNNCKRVPDTSARVTISWHLEGARLGSTSDATVAQTALSGPGIRDFAVDAALDRAPSVFGAQGRPLTFEPDIEAEYPLVDDGSVILSEMSIWSQTFADRAFWAVPFARTFRVFCQRGTWQITAICSQRRVEVPFTFMVGGVRLMDATFSFTDYFDLRLPARTLNTLRLGGNGWVDLGDRAALTLGNTFTQELWIQPDVTDDAFYGLLGNQPGGEVPRRSPYLYLCYRRQLQFGFGDGVGHQYGVTRPVLSGEPGRWHHIAASFDGTTYRIYVDGVPVHAQAMSKPPAASQVKWIGWADHALVGALAEVRLWTVVRTQAEIQADMHRRFQGTEPGLVGYWPLDDASEAGLRDRARSGAVGVLQGDAWLGAVDPGYPKTALWSPVLEFEADKFVALPASIRLVLGRTFTQELWIRPDLSDDAYHGLIGNQTTGDVSQRSPSLWVCNRRQLHAAYGDGVGQQDVLTGPVLSGESGRWHHVAAAFDGSTYRIYVDGTLVLMKTTSVPPTPAQVTSIGKADGFFFCGAIAEVRLWSVARTQSEILTDMNRRLSGVETGLVGYWPLDDGRSQVRDHTSAGNHGQSTARWRNGFATPSPDLPIVLPPSTDAGTPGPSPPPGGTTEPGDQPTPPPTGTGGGGPDPDDQPPVQAASHPPYVHPYDAAG